MNGTEPAPPRKTGRTPSTPGRFVVVFDRDGWPLTKRGLVPATYAARALDRGEIEPTRRPDVYAFTAPLTESPETPLNRSVTARGPHVGVVAPRNRRKANR